MTDEVKAALERYRPEEDYYEGIERDALTLADAYAAEHPPDEDEPITPEWLNELLPWDDYQDHDGKKEWSVYHEGHEILIHATDWDNWITLCINNHWWPMPLYTRGQLRRLLKELEE